MEGVKMHNVRYVNELYVRMSIDLESALRSGSTIRSAKAEILGRTMLAINSGAKKKLLQWFEALEISDLSEQTQKAVRIFDAYPEFRRKRRLPGTLERLRSLFFS
jgi:hypothetical protein